MFFKEVPPESDPLNFFTPDKNTLGVTPDKKPRRMQTPEDCYPLRIVTPGGFSPRRENPGGSLPGGLLPRTRVGASKIPIAIVGAATFVRVFCPGKDCPGPQLSGFHIVRGLFLSGVTIVRGAALSGVYFCPPHLF